jgi:hypothetical protein
MASKATAAEPQDKGSSLTPTSGDYVTPMLHVPLPRLLVDTGFWGGLVGAVALGVVDPPVGLLVAAGVVVARHRTRRPEAV